MTEFEPDDPYFKRPQIRSSSFGTRHCNNGVTVLGIIRLPSIAVAHRNDCLTPNDALVADLKWRIGRPEKNTAPVVIPFICATFAGRIPKGDGERLCIVLQ